MTATTLEALATEWEQGAADLEKRLREAAASLVAGSSLTKLQALILEAADALADLALRLEIVGERGDDVSDRIAELERKLAFEQERARILERSAEQYCAHAEAAEARVAELERERDAALRLADGRYTDRCNADARWHRSEERIAELAAAEEREAFNGNKWREEQQRAEAAEAQMARVRTVFERFDGQLPTDFDDAFIKALATPVQPSEEE